MAERLRAVLGIDLGTTETKAGIFDLAGRPLGLGRGAYPTDHGADGRAEQDPADWWAAVTEAVGDAMAEAAARGVESEIAAICGVSQGPTLAVVDAAGMPVRAAITWQDRRAADGGFGLLPKMAWLAREDPDGLARARWLMTAWDALGLWLTGIAATSMQEHESPLEARDLMAAGVDPGKVPPPAPVGTVLGGLGASAAAMLGIPAGMPVVVGVNDGTGSIVGAGLLEPGDAVDTGGASGGFGVYHDRPLDLPGTFVAPAPIPGRWVLGGAMAATGAALEWLRVAILDGRWSREELLAEASSVPPGSDGLVFLPYLAGERAPIFDDRARGTFVGLTLAHRRAHLVRAVIEGAAFAARHVAEPILAAGAPLRELRLAGGASRHPLWARVKADVMGVPVATPRVHDTALLGAAILAAAGAGLVPDIAAGVRAMTATETVTYPDPVAGARYDALYAVYRELYPVLAPTFHALADG